MARQRKRRDRFDLPPIEQQRAGAAITRGFVHELLVQATKNDDRSIEVRSVDSPEIGVLMQVLAFCRAMVARQRQNWAPSAWNYERFHNALRELDAVVPLLKTEAEDALRLAERPPPDVANSPPLERDWLIREWSRDTLARPAFAEAVVLLDALIRIGKAASDHPILNPPLPLPGDNWREYADGIRHFFDQAVIRTGTRSDEPIGNPFYSFLVLIIPVVTGEHVEFGQVREHFAHKRPNVSRQRRDWYKRTDDGTGGAKSD